MLMARAAAPMLSGLRVATRTTRRRSDWDGADKWEVYNRKQEVTGEEKYLRNVEEIGKTGLKTRHYMGCAQAEG